MKVAHLPIERGAVLKISSQLVFLKIECNREDFSISFVSSDIAAFNCRMYEGNISDNNH